MLNILLDPLKVQRQKTKKNNNISTIDSNYSNRNTEYFGIIKNNSINNYKNKYVDKNKKNIKVNINYINELIE